MDKRETKLFVRRLFDQINHQLGGRSTFDATIEYGSNDYDRVVPEKEAEVRNYLRTEAGLSTVGVEAKLNTQGLQDTPSTLRNIDFTISVEPREQQELDNFITNDWQEVTLARAETAAADDVDTAVPGDKTEKLGAIPVKVDRPAGGDIKELEPIGLLTEKLLRSKDINVSAPKHNKYVTLVVTADLGTGRSERLKDTASLIKDHMKEKHGIYNLTVSAENVGDTTQFSIVMPNHELARIVKNPNVDLRDKLTDMGLMHVRPNMTNGEAMDRAPQVKVGGVEKQGEVKPDELDKGSGPGQG